MTFFRSYDLHMTATANCAANCEKLSSFVFSHIMFTKNDDLDLACSQCLMKLKMATSGSSFDGLILT